MLSDNAFAEIRGGQYGYDWDNGVNGTGLRYEDTGNNLITGRNRNWARERRRDQVLGTFNYFKSGWGGDHNFKIGGEVFHETVKDIFIDGFEEDFMHVLQNGGETGRDPVRARRLHRRPDDLWRVHSRRLARQRQAHAQYRRAPRSLPCLLARADPPGEQVQRHGPVVPGRGQLHLVEPARAAHRHDLRPERRRQDRVESQLRQVLVEPRRRLRVQHPGEFLGLVEALRLDRYQQQRPLGAGRAGHPERPARRRGDRVARSKSRGHLHDRVRHVRRARADAELRRSRRLCLPRPAAAVRPLQHQPAG